MNLEPQIISSEEILRKYYESGIQNILHTFKKITNEYRNFGRRVEYYIDRKSNRIVLTRWYLKKEVEDAEDMCITWLIQDGKAYMAQRTS